MEKMLIVKPDDTIESVEYSGYESIYKAVDGTIETCARDTMHLATGGSLPITMYCNDEFLIREDEYMNKVNAVASLLTGTEIRGNVTILVDVKTDDGMASRGFEYKEIDDGNGEIEEDICEHWLAVDALMLYINHNRDKIQDLHQKFDNNKSKPKYSIHVYEPEV